METTILLADDHRIVREGLRRLLESRSDLSVIGEASNGEEAVEMAAQKHPDLVLMDISMPRLSGIDATRRICKNGNGTKVLVLSMHESQTYVEEVLRAGASGYVIKDSPPTDLFAAIDAVRSGDSFLSPSVTQRVVNAIARPGDRPSLAVSSLTERERQVLQLIAEGLSSKEIASKLGVSLKTVESHRANLMDKLDIHKVSGLVRFAIRAGLVAP
jgi:DNA-binding NarL/FixJ family response regulator